MRAIQLFIVLGFTSLFYLPSSGQTVEDLIEQKFVLQGALFETDSSSLLPQIKARLDELLIGLESDPDIEIEIQGHTNGIPDHEFCDRLSQARADTVREYLVENGIDSTRLKAVGYGKRFLAVDDPTSSANQRVVIKVLSN